jgi:hypothetical protein
MGEPTVSSLVGSRRWSLPEESDLGSAGANVLLPLPPRRNGELLESVMNAIDILARVALRPLAACVTGNSHPKLSSDVDGLATDDGIRPDPSPARIGASPVHREPFPTLAFIERAIGGAGSALTRSPLAPALESRARDLACEYWGDTVWTTGMVAATAFRRVLGELAPDVLRDWDDAEPPPATSGPTPQAVAEPIALDAPAGGAERTAA